MLVLVTKTPAFLKIVKYLMKFAVSKFGYFGSFHVRSISFTFDHYTSNSETPTCALLLLFSMQHGNVNLIKQNSIIGEEEAKFAESSD